MSAPPLEVLGRLLVVLALGLLLAPIDPAPRTATGPAAASVASSVGAGPAGHAVTALVTAPAGQDPLAAVPADFAPVTGYTPVPMRMADGTLRLAKPTGSCSVPGGGAPFGFHQACQVHDYGYDLLRYAHATGQPLTAEARRQLDAMFARDLHARCQVIGRGFAGAGCHLVADLFHAGVSFNSWRQHHGYPAEERLPGWPLALAVPVLAAPFLPRLRGRRRTGGRGGGRGLRALVDATPAGRDRYVDFLRAMSIVTVVLGHWTITAVRRTANGVAAGNVLSSTPWLWLATWVFQVMPVFFFVGGFANMVSWQAMERRGGGYVDYVAGRMARLLRPVLVFVTAWLALPLVLGRLGLPGEQVELVGKLMGQPLWFLGVYLTVVALAPVMVRLHRRFRLWVPATLAAVAAAVDALRFAAGHQQVGYLNLLVVWTLVQQVGFFYADGTLRRLSGPALIGLAAAGLGGLVVLTGTGLYPPSMVGLPGEESNMTPPTVCIVALTVWQVALVMLARGRVSAWLARRGPWTMVIAVGSLAMTMYLWHITAMVALYGLVLAVGGPLPVPTTGAWWATRPVWLALLAAVLTPLALVLSRFERPVRAGRNAASAAHAVETPTGRLAVVLGVALATLGLLGFTATGFAPLLDHGGARLLILQVDPVQNLVHLVAGGYLARTARAGLTERPFPWLLTAAGSALPLTLPAAGPVTTVLHAAVAVLALTVAATRHPSRSSSGFSVTGVRVVVTRLLHTASAGGQRCDVHRAHQADRRRRAALMAAIELRSPSFGDQQPIPARHAKDHGNLSPALEWSGVPEEAVELAVLCEDPDAPRGTFIHWVLAGLRPTATGLSEGEHPAAAVEGRNDFGEEGYGGPLPPVGHGPHRYVFRVFAASAPLGLAAGSSADDLRRALQGKELAGGTLVGTYQR